MNNWIVYKAHKEIDVAQEYVIHHCDEFTLAVKSDNRFSGDQVFYSDKTRLVVQDGVLLNCNELCEKYSTKSILHLINTIRAQNKYAYFNEFIGPFSGMYYDKDDTELLAYVNQTGDAPLFWYSANNLFAVSNDFNLIVTLLKVNGILLKLNETAANYIMTFGYMIDESTMICDVFRLLPGRRLIYNNGKARTEVYHRFNFDDKDMSMDEAIELVDKQFRKAVARCFDKDLEYGYTHHLSDMSGGFDSRMTNWVAHDMGYTDTMNICYSQFGSDEMRYAAGVSKHLGNQFLFKQLDDSSFIYDIDDIIMTNYGLAVFCGVTGGLQLISSLSSDKFGLEHSGQLGDVSGGTFYRKYTGKRSIPDANSIKYSSRISAPSIQKVIADYPENEMFCMYTRGYLGALSTHISRRHFYYTVSPFLDIDLINVIFSVPLKYRESHRFYWAWIDKKYPDAGKLPSTRKRPKSKSVEFIGRVMGRLHRDARKLLFKMKLVKSRTSPDGMNPFDYWYETDDKLRMFIRNYYETNKSLLCNYPDTEKNVNIMMASSKCMDKMLALTILGVMKNYFSKETIV
ncbi:MAG: asparagine synthase-related protein [Clostridia bacterium]